MDLKFPHHENEIAQTCAACDTPFVNVWMHNGFVRVDDEKMSKSLGNFFTLREVLEWVRDPEVARYFLLGSHYRGPINYTPESLAQADAALERMYLALRGVAPVAGTAPSSDATVRFVAALDDDFNTPVAFAELQSLARDVNNAKAAGDASRAATLAAELRSLGGRLGVLLLEPDQFLRKTAKRRAEAGAGTATSSGWTDAQIEDLLAQRAAARKTKNFAESDRIRDELVAGGILLEDQPGGRTLWRRGG
jgi:cysteinyl-tRNA synthetase